MNSDDLDILTESLDEAQAEFGSLQHAIQEEMEREFASVASANRIKYLMGKRRAVKSRIRNIKDSINDLQS